MNILRVNIIFYKVKIQFCRGIQNTIFILNISFKNICLMNWVKSLLERFTSEKECSHGLKGKALYIKRFPQIDTKSHPQEAIWENWGWDIKQ